MGTQQGAAFHFPLQSLFNTWLFRNVASTISSRFAAVEGLHDECVGVDPGESAALRGGEVEDNQVGSRSIMFVSVKNL